MYSLWERLNRRVTELGSAIDEGREDLIDDYNEACDERESAGLDIFIAEVLTSVDGDLVGHPDERMVPIPADLRHAAIRRAGVDVRRGRGYVLPDGAYIDPADGSIYCCETLP